MEEKAPTVSGWVDDSGDLKKLSNVTMAQIFSETENLSKT